MISKTVILCLFIVLAYCQANPTKEDGSKITSTLSKIVTPSEPVKKVEKRQLGGMGFDMDMEYYNALLDYAAYDYYDWVCTGSTSGSPGSCFLCDILTGSCCSPTTGSNCFLPDSCSNNPCLSGGTCIPTKTIPTPKNSNGLPDFICACRPGLTGKYCQLVDEFAQPAIQGVPPQPAIPPALKSLLGK